MKKPIIDVVIPAFNEAENMAVVLGDIPAFWVRDVVVCDNNSTDETALCARACGATVVFEPTAGYGIACLKALDFIKNKADKPDIVVFLDGDYSDDPRQLVDLIAPILGKTVKELQQFEVNRDENADLYWGGGKNAPMELVIGSRVRGNLANGALTVPQRFGNWLATTLIRLIFGLRFSDLGPFRAITFEALERIGMEDKNFGWTVEMQIKAAKFKLRTTEIAVDYRRRHAGVSKVSGSVKGAFKAGYIILHTIFKYS